nr:hypothetical protein BaRGS_019534 [Batillaria attramentaria]
MSVAVVKDGKTWTRGYGVKDLTTMEPTLLQDVLGDDFKLVYSLEKLVKIGDVLSHRTGLMAADILVAAGFPSGLDRGEFISADQAEASGALATSADDMTRWMQFLLNKGVSAGGQRILDPKALATIMTSHVSLTHTFDVPVEDVVKGYGFGWYTGSYRGKRKVLHTGEWFGYQASLQLFPDHHAAVYVAESGPGTAAGFDAINSISYYLADIALGYSPWVNETVACSLVEEARKANEREGKPKPELSNEELGDASDEFIVPVENAQRDWRAFLLPVGDQRDLADLKTIDFIVQYTGKTEFYSYEFETAEYSELSFVTSRGGSDDKSSAPGKAGYIR